MVGNAFSESDGGFNGGPIDLMVIMESLGRGLVVEPYIPNVVLAGGLISRLGSEDQKKELLPKSFRVKSKCLSLFQSHKVGLI